jgi:hypothetical protein
MPSMPGIARSVTTASSLGAVSQIPQATGGVPSDQRAGSTRFEKRRQHVERVIIIVNDENGHAIQIGQFPQRGSDHRDIGNSTDGMPKSTGARKGHRMGETDAPNCGRASGAAGGARLRRRCATMLLPRRSIGVEVCGAYPIGSIESFLEAWAGAG